MGAALPTLPAWEWDQGRLVQIVPEEWFAPGCSGGLLLLIIF